MLNAISRMSGKLIVIKSPRYLQNIINSLFVKLLKINMADFEGVDVYPSLQHLFTRELKKTRIFSEDPKIIISPTDSKIAQHGVLDRNKILQVKNVSYDVKLFLTELADADQVKKIENGKFINFYLSPQDYHHFHAPLNFEIKKIIHVPGTLFPVNKMSSQKVKNLFVKNERVILECFLENKAPFYFVAIGALNVGKIKIYKEPRLQTNTVNRKNPIAYAYPESLKIQKGDDLGVFEMGSSVVLLFAENSIEFSNIQQDQKILFGDNFATLNL